MATPRFDLLQQKVLQWANRDKEIFGVTANNPEGWKQYTSDFLSYAADEAYRLLRIPPLEYERVFTVAQENIVGTPNISVLGTNNWAGTGGVSYNKIPLPVDYTEMKSIRYVSSGLNAATSNYQNLNVNPGIVFNERTDERTFFDIYAETYSNYYWMRAGDYIYVKPALPVGAKIAFSYYRQLPALDSDYAVLPNNFLFTLNSDGVYQPNTTQPFLEPLSATFATSTTVKSFNQAFPSRIYFGVGSTLQTNTQIEVGDTIFITPPQDASGQYIGFYGQVRVTSVAALGAAFDGTAGNQYFECDQVFSQDIYPANATLLLTPALYFICAKKGSGDWFRTAAYATAADRTAAFATFTQVSGYTYTTGPAMVNSVDISVNTFTGTEVTNWLKDQNERILIWGALKHAGAFLDDDKIEARYEKKMSYEIDILNKEEQRRRTRGGNIQVHFNGRGMI